MTARSQELTTTAALRRLLVEAPPMRRGLIVTLLLAALGTGTQIIVPVVVQQIVDYELLDPAGVDVAGAVRRGLVALVMMFAAVFVRRASLLRLVTAASTGLSELRVKTFRHLHQLSILHVESERRGVLVARVTSDPASIQDFMDWGGVGMVIGAAQVLLAMAVMLIYGWQLAVMVFVGVLIYAVLLAWFQRILQRAHDQVRLRIAESLATMGEAISGLPVVRAYGAESATLDKVEAVLEEQFRAEFKTGRLGAFLFSSAELFAGLITAVVILVGVVAGGGWGMSAGTLLAFLFLVTLLVEPVQTLVETLDQAQSAAAGVRRILNVLDEAIDVPDPVDGVVLPDERLDLEFEGVRFRYPTGDDVLHDISVRVRAGSRIAVVGETGSGKSTFVKLATRLLDPTAGEVRLGDVPLTRVTFDSLRDHVIFVPQEGFLFDTTIADNVRYGKPGATAAEVQAAFEQLELGDWLAGLPDGLRTRVGERGGQLSAGERQLVALVRAWIADPELLILDEATSAVDPALEVRLRRAIEHLTEHRTSITVAHRLSTAEASDEVLVFDGGRIVERGSHHDLADSGGVYAALHADWMSSTG
ncbi:MAG: ABC transporter ATP-binding protein [Acidimicrobiia bacterium]|nr:ABC transporter ATP-binding protein [Acidimicrobiia bacterium]